MLILTRRLNESIMIGDDVTITVMRIAGNKVRIGIKAPSGVAVHREEIYEAIQSKQTLDLKSFAVAVEHPGCPEIGHRVETEDLRIPLTTWGSSRRSGREHSVILVKAATTGE